MRKKRTVGKTCKGDKFRNVDGAGRDENLS